MSTVYANTHTKTNAENERCKRMLKMNAENECCSHVLSMYTRNINIL